LTGGDRDNKPNSAPIGEVSSKAEFRGTGLATRPGGVPIGKGEASRLAAREGRRTIGTGVVKSRVGGGQGEDVKRLKKAACVSVSRLSSSGEAISIPEGSKSRKKKFP